LYWVTVKVPEPAPPQVIAEPPAVADRLKLPSAVVTT
jgi:hypothetical protein